MKLIIYSDHPAFHSYLNYLFKTRQEVTLKSESDINQIINNHHNDSTILILDAHTGGEYSGCYGIDLLKLLRMNDNNLPVLILCWFTRRHLLQQTRHNTSENRWLHIRYQSCYKICRLPLTEEDLINYIRNVKAFNYE